MGFGRLMAVVVLAALATPLGGGPLLAGRLGPHGLHGGRLHRHFRVLVPPPPWLISPYNNGPQFYGAPPFFPEDLTPPSPPAPSLSPAPPPSFSQGMAITVEKTLHADREDDGGAQSSPLIERPKQAAERLAACWSPPLPKPGETVEITIRFSFNGLGGVVGAPRVTYVKPGREMSVEDVRESIISAIKNCTPLHFSKSMAASAPGYPLAVRFVGRRAED